MITPELQAHSANCRGGDSVGDAGCFDVEGAEGEVGGLDGGRDEGEQGIRGGVQLSIRRHG